MAIKEYIFYSESGEQLMSRSTNTDSVGPYHVAAIDNIDGGNPSAISRFTGGCHGWNGDQSGAATASSLVGYKATKHLVTISVTNKYRVIIQLRRMVVEGRLSKRKFGTSLALKTMIF